MLRHSRREQEGAGGAVVGSVADDPAVVVDAGCLCKMPVRACGKEPVEVDASASRPEHRIAAGEAH